MTHWGSQSTAMLFHTVLEEWDDLDQLVDHVKDPVELAGGIHDSFATAFGKIPDPFLRHICLRGLRNVNFRQVADQLLFMIARQRQNQQTNAHDQKGPHQS